MSITREREVLAGRVGAAKRRGYPNVAQLERDLAAVRLAEYVERAVADAPPLTGEQIDRITAILHGSVAHAQPAKKAARKRSTKRGA